MTNRSLDRLTGAQLGALGILAKHTSIRDDRWVTPALFGALAYTDKPQPLYSSRSAARPAGVMLARLHRKNLVFRRKLDETGPFEYAITGNARLLVEP